MRQLRHCWFEGKVLVGGKGVLDLHFFWGFSPSAMFFFALRPVFGNITDKGRDWFGLRNAASSSGEEDVVGPHGRLGFPNHIFLAQPQNGSPAAHEKPINIYIYSYFLKVTLLIFIFDKKKKKEKKNLFLECWTKSCNMSECPTKSQLVWILYKKLTYLNVEKSMCLNIVWKVNISKCCTKSQCVWILYEKLTYLDVVRKVNVYEYCMKN